MLIAFLVLLGVNLIVVVAVLVSVLARKRWVKGQLGSFRGVIRVRNGEVDGLRAKWGRGYGRWVRDVLVWTKGPFFFRNELVAADGLDDERSAQRGEIKRLGDRPVVVGVSVGTASVEVAAHDEDHDVVLGPYRNDIEAEVAPGAMPSDAERVETS
jgi:hypothetical protein